MLRWEKANQGERGTHRDDILLSVVLVFSVAAPFSDQNFLNDRLSANRLLDLIERHNALSHKAIPRMLKLLES